MALQGSMRIGVPFDQAFPQGAMCLAVQADMDWEARKAGAPDPQRRDKVTGERVWIVRALDLDPLSRKGQGEVSVKIATPHQPVPPRRQDPRFPPLVVFEGLTLTPYKNNQDRLTYSMRADSMREPTEVEAEQAVAAREAAEAAALAEAS